MFLVSACPSYPRKPADEALEVRLIVQPGQTANRESGAGRARYSKGVHTLLETVQGQLNFFTSSSRGASEAKKVPPEFGLAPIPTLPGFDVQTRLLKPDYRAPAA